MDLWLVFRETAFHPLAIQVSNIIFLISFSGRSGCLGERCRFSGNDESILLPVHEPVMILTRCRRDLVIKILH